MRSASTKRSREQYRGSIYTRRQISLYRMFFVDISVNSQPIFMKFSKDYFRGTRRLPVYRGTS